MPKTLTESREDYLEAIAELIAVNGHAHTKEIARKLNVKMPSVTGALHQLQDLGYIVYNSHYPVQLTIAGQKLADSVIRRHRVLKKFFSDILGLNPEKASETACRLEHSVDEETISRFIIFSEAIEHRQDAKALQIYLTEAMSLVDQGESAEFCVLSELAPGDSGTVEKFGRNIAPGTDTKVAIRDQVTLEKVSLDRSIYTVKTSVSSVDIPLGIAENIWVKK